MTEITPGPHTRAVMRRCVLLAVLSLLGCRQQAQEDPRSRLFSEAHDQADLVLIDPDFEDDYAKVSVERGIACGTVRARDPVTRNYSRYSPYYYRRGVGGRIGRPTELRYGINVMPECMFNERPTVPAINRSGLKQGR